MKVSVIVPVYNLENYIDKCLNSLVNQTLKDNEIIIINDGSKDRSEQIIKDYQKKYSNIILISKENEGQAVARNIALKQAKGEYIMFVDGDDYIELNTLEITYNEAKKANADIVTFGISEVRNNKLSELNLLFPNLQNDTHKHFILNQAGPVAKLIKKNIFFDNNLFFPKLKAYEDIAVVPSYALFCNKIINIKDNLYYYLIRIGSTMNQTKYSKKLEEIYESLNNLLTIFKNSNKYNLYHDELEFLFIEHLLHGASLRFLNFDNYQINIDRIIKIMKQEFPDWNKNKYFKKQSLKYIIICNLIFKNKIKLVKKLLKN